MTDFLFQSGYPGLFLLSFLAATLLPLSSEILVVTMVYSGYDIPSVWLIATLGNFSGGLTNYYAGYYGEKFILSKYLKPDSQKVLRARVYYQKYGASLLFFSWVPVVGDPLCLIPGIFKLKLWQFTFWVLTGKGFRYYLVIYMAEKISNN